MGLLLSASVFACVIVALIFVMSSDDLSGEMHRSYAPWVYSVLLMLPALVCYGIDGIASVLKACMRRDVASIYCWC